MHRVDEREVRHLEDFSRSLTMRVAAWLAAEEPPSLPGAAQIVQLPELFHLATHLVLDTRLPAADRALLLAAVIYVVSPSDLIPEGILGTSGYRDDLLLVTLVLRRVLAHVPPEHVTGIWTGSVPLMATVEDILANGEKLVGAGVLQRLQAWSES